MTPLYQSLLREEGTVLSKNKVAFDNSTMLQEKSTHPRIFQQHTLVLKGLLLTTYSLVAGNELALGRVETLI